MLSFNCKKHSTIESLLKDLVYCKWLMTTTWFKYKKEYNLVKKLFEPKRVNEASHKNIISNNWKKYIECECGECDIDELDCKNYKFCYRFNFKINKTYIETMYKELEKYRGTAIWSNGEWNSKYHLPYLIYNEYNSLYDIGGMRCYFKNKKIDLEELTKEAFKPSRIAYVFSLHPDYEF